MRIVGVLAVVTGLVAGAAVSRANIAASAQVNLDSKTGNTFNYSLTLKNTGDTGIGSFWFAWIPGYDFLTSLPTVTGDPSGWSHGVMGVGGGFDGYSIQWVDDSTALAPGGSVKFHFSSADSPSVLSAPSAFFSFYNTTTSFVYPGLPELDPGNQFVATVVAPEPATGLFLAAGVAGVLVRRVHAKPKV